MGQRQWLNGNENNQTEDKVKTAALQQIFPITVSAPT